MKKLISQSLQEPNGTLDSFIKLEPQLKAKDIDDRKQKPLKR